MTIPLLTFVTLLTGTAVGWLLVRRPVPVPAPAGQAPPAERTIWSRSARELYRTVLGVVDDLDPATLLPDDSAPRRVDPPEPAAADPLAVRAWVNGAIVRARGASTWAVALREQAIGSDAETACARVAADLSALADAASAVLVVPEDLGLADVLDARRQAARRDAERLVRLL
jgi:hypothetical protein